MSDNTNTDETEEETRVGLCSEDIDFAESACPEVMKEIYDHAGIPTDDPCRKDPSQIPADRVDFITKEIETARKVDGVAPATVHQALLGAFEP